MEQALDFVRAAAPWAAVGLLPAIFTVRCAGRKKGKRSDESQGAEGMRIFKMSEDGDE